MSDTECPYCGAEIEICHDDGYGLDEFVRYEQDCPACLKTFAYTTTHFVVYTTFVADCLNGGEHRFRVVRTANDALPRTFRCIDCGAERLGDASGLCQER